MSYIKVTYKVQTQGDILECARDIAYGQSIGNPYIRTPYDDNLEKLIPQYAVDTGHVRLYFPRRNFTHKEGMNYLLSVLMGGQMDISRIKACELVNLDLGTYAKRFPLPRYGVVGVKKLLGVQDRPLFGGIIKPKIGLTPEQMADVCLQMADGGIDFIKEDEILGDPRYCSFNKRVPLIAKRLSSYKLLYAPCITADGSEVYKRAKLARELGATAIHFNMWCGLGTYLDIREKIDLPLFFQKSGDKVITTGYYSINSRVWYQLIKLIGCDFAHVGMFGGYLSESLGEIRERIYAMTPCIPSFSCGAYPGLVRRLIHLFGNDIMITSGGSIHGHPMGVTAGVKAFRQAVYGYDNPPPELNSAIKLWGVAK